MIKLINKFFSKRSSTREKAVDFSHIDSPQKLVEAAEKEELFPILMFPEIFGGENIDVNRLYVPPGVPGIHNKIIATIARFLEEGLIDNMQVTPQFKGSSLIPSKILIETFKDGNAGQFNPTIDVW